MGRNDASFKWYAIMGNHDYEGSLDAYLNFHNDSRWHFDTNYSVSPAGSDATFVFLDTNRAVRSYLSPPYGDCREYCAEQLKRFGCTPTTVQDCWTKHLDWAASALAAATTRWKFVLGHHPIDNTDLMAQLAPVLEKHGAQAYFSGHVSAAVQLLPSLICVTAACSNDHTEPTGQQLILRFAFPCPLHSCLALQIHNLQHASSNGVQYFVSGAGGFSTVAMEAEAAADAANGVIHGTSHLPRLLTCPEGASCYPMLNNFAGDGPGYLTMALNNSATTHTATATFYSAGKAVYSGTFSA